MDNSTDEVVPQELTPSVVEGYKVGAKKSIEELSKLDPEDGKAPLKNAFLSVINNFTNVLTLCTR